MPELQLPIFPEGATHITGEIGFTKKDGLITYFYGYLPILMHEEKDLQTFRMITSQMIITGHVKQVDIVKAFGVPLRTVKRYVRLYREKGPKGFYAPRNVRGATVLTPEVLKKIQKLFEEGKEANEVGLILSIKPDTIKKGIKAGKLYLVKDRNPALRMRSKSERSIEDNKALMGVGATNMIARVAASLGKLNGVAIEFHLSVDVPYGGVLFALPALLLNGLLRHTAKKFSLAPGYYNIESIFLLLGFLALARIKVLENLRYVAPGEWGNLLGLDRIPEVKTVREKIKRLIENDRGKEWSAQLCQEWLEAGCGREYAGYYYVDGHVQVYYGTQTLLPRHYVSRERLCLRATIDYWVNAVDGQPFFLVNKAIDPGLLHVLREDIVPRLEAEVPCQPTKENLQENIYLHRFIIIFDREGYSPEFMKEMKDKRIACITYNKFPGKDWSEREFMECETKLIGGEKTKMRLAERGTLLRNGLWVREIRKLTEAGHQTSVITTDYITDFKDTAVAMFARWCQEAFFKYMMEQYNIDRLWTYETENIPDTSRVINPSYRRIDGQVRSQVSKLDRKLKEFGAIILSGNIEPDKVESYQKEKGKLQEEISLLQKEVVVLKAERKTIPKHISFKELPQEERFDRLSTQSKYFIDTIKMIAYRAETSMANILRDKMSHTDEARRLLQALYNTESDIIPDKEKKTLTVRLHHLANWSTDTVLSHLCSNLNETETVFPGTDLKLVYELSP